MYLKKLIFDHNAESFHDGLKISNDIKNLVKEKIIFSSISNALQSWDLFEDENDAPTELTSVTGDLAKSLSLIDNELEYSFMLLSFHSLQQNCKNFLSKYRFMKNLNRNSDSFEDKEQYLKMKVLSAIMELKNQEENSDDEDNTDIFAITETTMKNRIKLIKKSKYNFNTYLEMMKGNYTNNTSSDFNIDNILGDLLNKKDGDD